MNDKEDQESLLAHHQSARKAAPLFGAIAGLIPDGTWPIDLEDSLAKRIAGSLLRHYKELETIDRDWPEFGSDVSLVFASNSQTNLHAGPWQGKFSSVHASIHSWVHDVTIVLGAFESAANEIDGTLLDILFRNFFWESRGEPSFFLERVLKFIIPPLRTFST